MEEFSKPQILLFFTTEPSKVASRILRFRTAFLNCGKDFEFAIVSFSPSEVTAVKKTVVGNAVILHYVYGPDAIETLEYPVKGSKKPFRLIPGNCDLVPLLFWKSHPQYDHVWVMEDDVEYSGDPGFLFSDLARKKSDVLAAHVANCPDGWIYEGMLRSPGTELAANDKWVTFFPFYRVSRNSLEVINRHYLAGWDGHHEMVWPTILKLCNHDIVDIGGQGAHVLEENVNKHYLGLPGKPFEKRGSFGTMHIRLRVGSQKNVLWHPVKQPKAWVRQKAKRTISIAKWKYGRLIAAIAGVAKS